MICFLIERYAILGVYLFGFMEILGNFAKLIKNDITRYNEKEISCI